VRHWRGAREAHALTAALGREVVVGGTEVFSPDEFVSQLARLNGARGGTGGGAIREDDEIDLDDLIIE
jgi:syntaxin-binding protein 1